MVASDGESSSLERSVDLLASNLIGQALRASTEELAASAIVADVGFNAAQQLAADVQAISPVEVSKPLRVTFEGVCLIILRWWS